MNADLPPLKDVIAAHGLNAKKSLGQHFLLDLNLTRRIVRAAGDLNGHSVIEIGPGPGGLTRALVESEAKAIFAIEKDTRCIEALQPLVIAANGRLQLIEGDALKVDASTLGAAPRSVIANLPYNVGTQLLIDWLQQADAFTQFVLMFQKEVAQRIVAKPDTEAYGRLSVICQFLCDCNLAFTIPARAFTPPPKVDSAVVVLKVKRGAPEVPLSALEKVTAAAFGKRRKMLRSIFKDKLGDAGFAAIGIKPEARGEALSVADFVRLAKALT